MRAGRLEHRLRVRATEEMMIGNLDGIEIVSGITTVIIKSVIMIGIRENETEIGRAETMTAIGKEIVTETVIVDEVAVQGEETIEIEGMIGEVTIAMIEEIVTAIETETQRRSGIVRGTASTEIETEIGRGTETETDLVIEIVTLIGGLVRKTETGNEMIEIESEIGIGTGTVAERGIVTEIGILTDTDQRGSGQVRSEDCRQLLSAGRWTQELFLSISINCHGNMSTQCLI